MRKVDTKKKLRVLIAKVERLQGYAIEEAQREGKKGMRKFMTCERLNDLEGALNDAAASLERAHAITECV